MFTFIILLTILLTIILILGINTMNYTPINNYRFENSIRKLYRQTSRWAAAAIQDDSEIIRVLHANYATGYLWAIKDIVSNTEFKHITGEDLLLFENKIVKIQDDSTIRLINKCKSLIFAKEPILFKAMYSA